MRSHAVPREMAAAPQTRPMWTSQLRRRALDQESGLPFRASLPCGEAMGLELGITFCQ